MRHHRHNRKFGRERSIRKAFIKSLATSLIARSSIKTTEARAKELRPHLERLITIGKKESLASRRHIARHLSAASAKQIVEKISPRYKGRAGGYLRIIKLPDRLSDGSAMAVVEFV